MNKNSGYIGWSMSRRAGEAYDNGLAPLSKIGRGKFVRAAAAIVGRAERHHTSLHCNLTDFYSVARVLGCAAYLRRTGITVADVLAVQAARSEHHTVARPSPFRRARKLMIEARRYEIEAAKYEGQAAKPIDAADLAWQMMQAANMRDSATRWRESARRVVDAATL